MKPIIALDFDSVAKAQDFLAGFPIETSLVVKVGMELFYAAGPQFLATIQERPNTDIFLDLKLHDIPHTVEKAAYQLGRLGIAMTTIHASGGEAMITAARRGLDAGAHAAHVKAPKLLAVTQLTSSDQSLLTNQLGIQEPVARNVQRLAAIAQAAGADGVIASALEVSTIRAVVRDDFWIVTPGIRPAGSAVGDQRRVVTPQQAHQIGSTAIVVGRPITQASNPVTAYESIVEEWENDHVIN